MMTLIKAVARGLLQHVSDCPRNAARDFHVPSNLMACTCGIDAIIDQCKSINAGDGNNTRVNNCAKQIQRLIAYEALRCEHRRLRELPDEVVLAMSESEYEKWLNRPEVRALEEKIVEARWRADWYTGGHQRFSWEPHTE